MSENPTIVLDGDVSPFRQKMREAAADLKKFGEDGKNSFDQMGGPLEALRSKFIAIGALLAGGKVFGEAINAAKEFYGETGKLSKSFGISEEGAIALKIALGDLYIDTDTATSAVGRLTMVMNTAPEKFAQLGVAISDSSGKSRSMMSIMLDVVARINEYTEGTDRARAMAYMFGKSWQDVQKIMSLTNAKLDEAAAKARELGIEIRGDDIREYRAAMNDVNDVFEAMNVRIGTALIPSLKSLAVYFAQIGGPVINAVIWGFKHLVQFLDETATAIMLVWNDVKYVFDQLTSAAGQMGASIASILQGNISDAKEIWKEGSEQLLAQEKKHLSEYERLNAEHLQRVNQLWSTHSKAKANQPSVAAGKKKFTLTDDEGKATGAKDPSMMAYYELALAEEKRLASEKDALREYTKQEELAFWQTLLQHANLVTKDRVAIEKKASELTVAIRRSEAKEIQDISAEAIAYNQALAIGRVDAESAAAAAAVASSQMSKQELAQLEIQFEQRRLEIQRAALQERLVLAEQDPNASPLEKMRIQNQLEQLEQQHGIRMIQLQSRVAQESAQIWDDLGQRMSSLWDKGVQAIMNGTFRWRSAFKAVGMELVGWFANSVVGEMVKKWLAGEVQKLAIKMGFLASEKTAQTVASAQIIGTKTTEATSVATANAVEAGSGAAASQASIPFAGPVLALAAMAAIFAAVMGMGSKVKSASRGFSIPKGMNPMTQLHEEEMVLPSHLSKGIASLIDQGGSGGQATAPVVNLHFNSTYQDRAGIKRLLMDNPAALAAAARNAIRMGHDK